MLGLKTLANLHRPILPSRLSLFSSFSVAPPSSSLCFPRRSLSTIASVAMSTITVEHFVLFSVKPDTTSTQIDSMLLNLRSLTTLPSVTHLTALPVLRHRSSAAEPITHILHGRYPTKPDLAAYSDHPSHLSVVKNFVLPICSDIIAVDWISDSPPKIVEPGSAARLTLVKVKEEAGESGKGEILEVLKGVKEESLGSAVKVEDVSYGLNFSPGRSKGYEVGMLAVFPGVEELDGLDKLGEELEKHKEKVRPLLESVMVLDFVVPASASL